MPRARVSRPNGGPRFPTYRRTMNVHGPPSPASAGFLDGLIWNDDCCCCLQKTRRIGPSGPSLVSSTGDAEKTASMREESEGLFAHPDIRKAVVGSLELAGGHESWNPLRNV